MMVRLILNLKVSHILNAGIGFGILSGFSPIKLDLGCCLSYCKAAEIKGASVAAMRCTVS